MAATNNNSELLLTEEETNMIDIISQTKGGSIDLQQGEWSAAERATIAALCESGALVALQYVSITAAGDAAYAKRELVRKFAAAADAASSAFAEALAEDFDCFGVVNESAVMESMRELLNTHRESLILEALAK